MVRLLQDALSVLDHWQTLVAGLLALVAAGGTVWGTLAAAKRQVKAANDAADRQIKATAAAADRQVAAAQEQTQAAQRQTAEMRHIDRRRVAQEEYAFHAMLVAAMEAVIEDVEAVRNLPGTETHRTKLGYSAEAYAKRQRVKRAGFAELRTAFIRFGAALTEKFLRLDKEIEKFAGAVWTAPAQPVGLDAGLEEQLDRIQQQASTLRQDAEVRMKILIEELERLRA